MNLYPTSSSASDSQGLCTFSNLFGRDRQAPKPGPKMKKGNLDLQPGLREFMHECRNVPIQVWEATLNKGMEHGRKCKEGKLFFEQEIKSEVRIYLKLVCSQCGGAEWIDSKDPEYTLDVTGPIIEHPKGKPFNAQMKLALEEELKKLDYANPEEAESLDKPGEINWTLVTAGSGQAQIQLHQPQIETGVSAGVGSSSKRSKAKAEPRPKPKKADKQPAMGAIAKGSGPPKLPKQFPVPVSTYAKFYEDAYNRDAILQVPNYIVEAELGRDNAYRNRYPAPIPSQTKKPVGVATISVPGPQGQVHTTQLQAYATSEDGSHFELVQEIKTEPEEPQPPTHTCLPGALCCSKGFVRLGT